MKTVKKRGDDAVRMLRLAVRAQEQLMDANAAIDWTRADGARAWEAAIRLRRATNLAKRIVDRFESELARQSK